MPKRSDDYMAERRRQILGAAIVCMSRLGWNHTTVDAVAREAGLSKGAVYVHFESKRALLLGLIGRNLEEIEARRAIDSFEALREDLMSGMEILDEQAGWLLCIGQMEAQVQGVRDPELREMLNRGSQRMVEVFTGIVARLRPELSPAEARSRALGLILVFDGMRSFRTISELSAADMRAILDREIEALRPA
jgi:AcrR family transcriptional regulator